MDKEELLLKLKSMTIEEKLALLSDTDKAYLRGFLDRSALEMQRRMRELSLPKDTSTDTVKNGVTSKP